MEIRKMNIGKNVIYIMIKSKGIKVKHHRLRYENADYPNTMLSNLEKGNESQAWKVYPFRQNDKPC